MQTEILGLKTEYERMGAGKPVLILHGWAASIGAVRSIANCMVSLGYEAVCLDFPGFGGSEEPKEPWGVPEYAQYTREFIRNQKIEGCHVICHSFGGRVTILLAAQEPGLFDKLVLVDAAGVRGKRGLKYYLAVWKDMLGKRLYAIPVMDRMFHLKEKQKNAGSADYRALKSDVMRQTFVKVVNLDLKDRLDNIQNETLLVWGDQDDATPLERAYIMEKRIKNSGLAVLQGAGHFSYADRYPQFCAVMKSYFGKQGEI